MEALISSILILHLTQVSLKTDTVFRTLMILAILRHILTFCALALRKSTESSIRQEVSFSILTTENLTIVR